ncbi:hypothetical protein MNBD_GAMMA03-227 [hydrothermal vent metagenome]|uniref:Uncharacterized protein n=1 Tax=hydrothermal vent metagenome TaxID=652676 RepID=A0A3B0W9V0_9ZZZZ
MTKKITVLVSLLIASNISHAQLSGKFVKLNKCILQIGDKEETKYSGKHYLNLSKIERIMTALNHVELMLGGKGIVIFSSVEEKKKIIEAVTSCSD